MMTNHEVLTHLVAMKARYTEQHERGARYAMKPENVETMMKEVFACRVSVSAFAADPLQVQEYLQSTPCAHQSEENIVSFMEATEGLALTKAELLMMLNELSWPRGG